MTQAMEVASTLNAPTSLGDIVTIVLGLIAIWAAASKLTQAINAMGNKLDVHIGRVEAQMLFHREKTAEHTEQIEAARVGRQQLWEKFNDLSTRVASSEERREFAKAIAQSIAAEIRKAQS
jgi:hypothetical protein